MDTGTFIVLFSLKPLTKLHHKKFKYQSENMVAGHHFGGKKFIN